MNLERIVPGVPFTGLSHNRKNWIFAGFVLLATIPLVRFLNQFSTALALSTTLFFILLAGLCTMTFGGISGVVGLTRVARRKLRRGKPKEFGAAPSSHTVVTFSNGGRTHSTFVGLGVEIIPVPVIDEDGNRRLMGVQYNKRKKSATIFLVTDGNSRLAFSSAKERFVLDKRIAEVIENAQFEAGKGLVTRLICARRPTSALALAEELTLDLAPSIGRAWLNMRDTGRLKPSSSDEVLSTNIKQKFAGNVDGKPQYINLIALTLRIPPEWTVKPDKADPVKNSQVELLRASQVIEDGLGQLGYANVHPASLLEMHIYTRSLLDIANLPGYLEDVEDEIDSDESAAESSSLDAGPWPTTIVVDDQTICLSKDTFFRPFRRSISDVKQMKPGGLDEFYGELPGWYTACLRIQDLNRSTTRRRVEYETQRAQIKAKANRRAAGDPGVAKELDELDRRINQEFDARGGISRGDLFVLAGATKSSRCISDAQRLERLARNKHGLPLAHVPTQKDELAAVMTATGVDV